MVDSWKNKLLTIRRAFFIYNALKEVSKLTQECNFWDAYMNWIIGNTYHVNYIIIFYNACLTYYDIINTV